MSNVHAVDDDGLEALASRLVERATPGSGRRGGRGGVFHVVLREAHPALMMLMALDERRQRLVSRGRSRLFFAVNKAGAPLQQTGSGEAKGEARFWQRASSGGGGGEKQRGESRWRTQKSGCLYQKYGILVTGEEFSTSNI